jgi:hypothetical protein
VDCHQSLVGKLGDVVSEWRDSPHGQVGVGCEGCHQGDPGNIQSAKSSTTGFVGMPRLREVPYFCGRCHEGIMEKHLASPHGALGLPNCVTCHGSHTIRRRPEEIIVKEACSKCHSFEPAVKSLESLIKANTLLAELDRLVQEIKHIPAVSEHLSVAQREMRLDQAGVLETFHSFRIGDIQGMGMNVVRLRKTLQRLHDRERTRVESLEREVPFILMLMGFLLLASLFGFFVFHGRGEVEAGK